MTAPSIYLDWSTLCDAFRAIDERGKTGPVVDLFRLVAAMSAEGTLAYSSVHLIELLAWEPKSRAMAMAHWLDSLPHFYLQPLREIEEDEIEYWVRLRLGQANAPCVAPLTNMSGALARSFRPEGTPALLGSPSLATAVDAAHGTPFLAEDRTASTRLFMSLHRDRAHLTDAERLRLRDVTDGKFRRFIVRRALQLHLRLVGELDVQYGALRQGGSMSTPPSVEDVRAAAQAVVEDHITLPVHRAVRAVTFGIGEEITRQQPQSSSFRRRYASAAHDLMHLGGAAYCGIFTCDQRIDRALGSFRVERGMAPQLSLGNTASLEAFVAELRAQFERLLE